MYDNELISGKLRRWSNYLHKHNLPEWEQLPDFGLYMDQVQTLLAQYLSFLPQDSDEQVITTSAINNYVRTGIMPPPNRKKYERIHIAYLIMICSLKQSLSMSEIQKIIPSGLSEDEIRSAYTDFCPAVHRFRELLCGACGGGRKGHLSGDGRRLRRRCRDTELCAAYRSNCKLFKASHN